MWKMCITAVAMCLLLANAALAAEFKVAYVDMREIVTNSEPAKKAKATLTAKFGAERDRLEKQGRELQKEADSLKSPAANQSREALEQKRSEFIRKRQDLDQKARDFSIKVEEEEAKLRDELLELVFKTARDFSVKKGITYLVDAGSVLYADSSLDATKEFMEEVNRQWKDSPPPAASGGAKKK